MEPRCRFCREANPLQAPFPPPGWVRGFGQVAWAQDVWRCGVCGTTWHLGFDPKEMLYVDVVPFSPPAVKLIMPETTWAEACALRDLDDPIVPRYLALFLERTPYRWPEVAGAVVPAIVDAYPAAGEARRIALLGYLRGLFANYNAVRDTASVDDVVSLRDAMLPLAPDAAATADLRKAWTLWRERADETCDSLARYFAAASQARVVTAPPRVPVRPLEPGVSNARLPGPAPLADRRADRAGARDLVAGALGRLFSRPSVYGAPVALMTVAVEALGPKVPGGADVAPFALGVIALYLYAAAASVAAGRWPVSARRLWVDRFSDVLSPLFALLLVVPAWLALLFGLAAIFGSEWSPPFPERTLWYAAFFVVGWRLWPMITIPFVYRGYRLFERVSIGPRITWIGPDLRDCWRLTGQPGFFSAATLPLGAFLAIVLTLVEAAGAGIGARLAVYAVALPLAVQFADEAVDRWRVATGNRNIDR